MPTTQIGWGSEIRLHSCETRNHNPWRKFWIQPATWTNAGQTLETVSFFPLFRGHVHMFISLLFLFIFQLENEIPRTWIFMFAWYLFLMKPRLVIHQKWGTYWANISLHSAPESIAQGNEVQQMQRTFVWFSPFCRPSCHVSFFNSWQMMGGHMWKGMGKCIYDTKLRPWYCAVHHHKLYHGISIWSREIGKQYFRVTDFFYLMEGGVRWYNRLQ